MKHLVRPKLEVLEDRLCAATTSYPYLGFWPGAGRGPLTVTYSYHASVQDGVGAVSYDEVRGVVEGVLRQIAGVAPLSFVEQVDRGPPPNVPVDASYPAAGYPQIRVLEHPIDGPGGVLAHAAPAGNNGKAGDVCLDSAEAWSLDPSSGVNLHETLLHELLHAQGLNHLPDPNAILYAYYQARPNPVLLQAPDVAALQGLYGVGHGTVTPGWSTPLPPVPPAPVPTPPTGPTSPPTNPPTNPGTPTPTPVDPRLIDWLRGWADWVRRRLGWQRAAPVTVLRGY